VTARTIFARCKARTICEVQKKLFERDYGPVFPYSLDKVKDTEPPILTDDDILALDSMTEDEIMALDEEESGEQGDGESLSDEDGPRPRSRAGNGSGSGPDSDSDSASGKDRDAAKMSLLDLSAKEIATKAFSFYQKAVTVAWKQLDHEEQEVYILRGRLARAKGLSEEDKQRFALYLRPYP
jgi:hypothetical protein